MYLDSFMVIHDLNKIKEISMSEVFYENFNSNYRNEIVPKNHPIHILMEEHEILLKLVHDLSNVAQKLQGKKGAEIGTEEVNQLNAIIERLKASESHYVREENVLFPYLEKHGVTGPPSVMWAEHNQIRDIKKRIYKLISEYNSIDYDEFVKRLSILAQDLSEMLQTHFYKENNVLFPTALNIFAENEWLEIKSQFDEIGYCCFSPEHGSTKSGASEVKPGKEEIQFETGSFSKDELETLLNSFPVDITFVDKNDTVRYFNQSKDRIFPRMKAVIGRKVQNCHPPQSLDKVEQILRNFKDNKRDVAEFWINFKDRFVHIRYFALRRDGQYIGTLEVTQDITDIKKLEGEKRLL